MSIKIAIFDYYFDQITAEKIKNMPVFNTIILLYPPAAQPSARFDGWTQYAPTLSARNVIPPNSIIQSIMEFEANVDAGIDYRMEIPMDYDTIKYGKPYKVVDQDNLQKDLSAKELGADTWAIYEALEPELRACIGSPREHKFIVEIIIKKVAPKEVHKNWETCKLAIYELAGIIIHVNADVQKKIADNFAAHGPVQLINSGMVKYADGKKMQIK